MKRRSLKEFSFGYEIAKNGSRKAKDGALDLTELDLAEVGPTLKGMNPATELHAVKSALDEQTDTTATELQEVKARLDTLEKALEDLSKKAEETDRQPVKADSVDTLRRQADELELRFASNGMSLEKPPAPVAPSPPPDLVDLDELKQRMRDDMLIHLNGDIE